MPADFDYIIVGSGAGGGPLAANLAKAGFKVLLMEAGADPCSTDDTGRFMYEVPIFHGLSTEYKACAWDYFVRHYTADAQQAKDSKTVKVGGEDRIWYPRAGTLGGCTAHNAMITVIPQDDDWNYIAGVTGDSSWQAENMRGYFERLERCTYVAEPGSVRAAIENTLSTIGGFFQGKEGWRDHSEGHGFKGWLSTSEADPALVLKDEELICLLLNGVKETLVDHVGSLGLGVDTRFDPNDARNTGSNPEGLVFTPLAVDQGKRNGPRDYLLRVQKQYPDNLTIRQNVLATRVIFEGKRAVGVEFIDRAHVYRADPQAIADASTAPRQEVRTRGEVILAAGAFNTPQLLMLSGVGPSEQLQQFGIQEIVNLPGVGANLQDRYEIGVVSEFKKDFALIQGGTFSPPDPDPDAFLKLWETKGSGVYASNGALIGIIKKSSKELKDPDLYIFGLPGFFRGYKPGYSKLFEYHHNRFTWAILKARTNNTGHVTLESANPWDRPSVNFQYFGDGGRANDPDLDALVNGVAFARDMNRHLEKWGLIEGEDVPGPAYQSDDAVREFIRNEAWGHHASCTCKIGSDTDEMAVLDSRFRVRGTESLRVVDASVFPKIPGYFIVSAIYMISEKAADVIQQDAVAG
jgi:choline dehydrogenase